MKTKESAFLDLIDSLVEKIDSGNSATLIEVGYSTLSLLLTVYGESDARFRDYQKLREKYTLGAHDAFTAAGRFAPYVRGRLLALKSELQAGLLGTIERLHTGEVISDFTVMARQALESDQLAVAAVLVCAALEDSLKRTAKLAGLDVDDKHMPEVITALVAAQVILGPQSKMVRAFAPMRNKVMHADFDKVDSADIKAMLAFTEEFILKNLSN